MTFRTLTIGARIATPVVVPDMGFRVPAVGGGLLTLTDPNRLDDASNSDSLRALATDGVPAMTDTLVLNDGGRDIPQSLVSARLDSLTRFEEDWIVVASGPGMALHSTTVVTAGGNVVTAIGP